MKSYKIKLKKNSNILCHVPHSSIFIPPVEKKFFLVKKTELQKESKKMADLFTFELFSPAIKKTSAHIATISRIVVDMERFIDDEQEPMSKVGMGVAYTKTSGGKHLRKIDHNEKQRLVEKYFHPYHKALESHVSDMVDKHSKCLIIDCHSFTNKPGVYELNKKTPRPDICLGVDKFHTQKKLWEAMQIDFECLGYTVEINEPYSGTMVPPTFYRRNNQVHSILIEVNRKLYMNERTFKKNKNFSKVSKDIQAVINNISSQYK